MYETKRHMRKLGKQTKRHGLRKAVEYDWKKSHPIARTGFGLISALTLTAALSIGTIWAHNEYQDYREKNPKVEQPEPIANQPSNITMYYQKLERLLD